MAEYVGALDQGTTSTRFMVFDHDGAEVGRHQPADRDRDQAEAPRHELRRAAPHDRPPDPEHEAGDHEQHAEQQDEDLPDSDSEGHEDQPTTVCPSPTLGTRHW